jgi:single-stranded-DNA-specific exonuclease
VAQSFSGQRKVSPEFRQFLVEAMALVSMATVTDVVPLRDENRVLTFHGLQALAVSQNPGIQALLRVTRLKGQVVRAVHVGYRLGPRLNAAGRMGMAGTAIELLTTSDCGRAAALADELESANQKRRLLEQEMLAEILRLPEIGEFPSRRALCLGKRGWHAGVIGIVASRLVDRFGVPVLLVALDGDRGRGSARAAPGVNLAEILGRCGEHLAGHGGHSGAAGCTVCEPSFPKLRQAFEAEAARALAASTHVRALEIDLELPFRAIRPALVEELELLAPHGQGNPPALFCARGVEIAGRPRIMGKERTHLAFFARQGDRVFRAVAFGRADLAETLARPGIHVDLAYRLKFDSYYDPGAIELEVADVLVAN